MGLVKKGDAKEHSEKKEEAPEDPPVVRSLKVIDDKYLELEREYEREVAKLEAEYSKRKVSILEERKKMLATADGDSAASGGTPALSGFWLKALSNFPDLQDSIQEWDAPVLEFLADVETSLLDEMDSKKGFILKFHFAENPYFTNSVLTKQYVTEEMNPWNGELAVKEIKSDAIDWKAGKDVTVEKVAKKVKGGGAKKAKQKNKETVEPRPSFFREFFRNLSPDMSLTEDMREELMAMKDEDDEIDDEDDPQMLEYIMDNDRDMGQGIRDFIVPFAVRWYTGEAVPEGMMDDDDEDDEEEDDDDEDEDDDDESEDDSPAKGRGKGKKAGGAKKQGAGAGAGAGAEGKQQEECKQQ